MKRRLLGIFFVFVFMLCTVNIPIYAQNGTIMTILLDDSTYNEWTPRENGCNVWFWKNAAAYKKNVLNKNKTAEITLSFDSGLSNINEGFVFTAPRLDLTADNAYLGMKLYQEVSDNEKMIFIGDESSNGVKIPFGEFCSNESGKWMDVRIPVSYMKKLSTKVDFSKIMILSIFWQKSNSTLKTSGSSEKVYLTDIGFYNAAAPENLEITGVTEAGIQLEWEGKADKYKIYCDGECVGETESTNYTDRRAYDDFNEYKVAAVYDNIESAFCEPLKNPFINTTFRSIEFYDEALTNGAWSYTWPSKSSTDGSGKYIAESTAKGFESNSSIHLSFPPSLSWGNMLVGFSRVINAEDYKKDGYISMYIKASKETTALTISLMNTDSGGERIYDREINIISDLDKINDWNEVKIPFSSFSDSFDFRAVTGMRLLYKGSSEKETVDVYIDKLKFVSATSSLDIISSGLSSGILEGQTYYSVSNTNPHTKLFMAYFSADGKLKKATVSAVNSGKAFAMLKTDNDINEGDKIKVFCWSNENEPIREVECVYTQSYNDAAKINIDKWFVYGIPDYNEITGTALDMSHLLDAPAGKHGKILADGDDFVFEDGTKARFWGVNIVGESNFMSHEETDKLIKALTASGVNVVRLHHLDAGYYSPNIFGSDKNSIELDANQMDKFNYFWAKLKENGIYIMPGLLCSRVVTSAMGITDAGSIDAGMKIEGMFDEDLIALQKDYAKKLLTYKNPYTGTTLATDPASVLYEIHNECNITEYGNSSNYTITSQYYLDEFYELFNNWLLDKYKTQTALVKSWGSTGSESLTKKSITFPANYKSLNYSKNRMTDCREFLYYLANSYHTEMIDYIKNELGTVGLVTGVNNITNELGDIHENANYSHMDRHVYWAHPMGGYTVSDGVYNSFPDSLLKKTGYNLFNVISQNKVMGKPLIVSEWQICHPNQYIAEAQLLGSAIFAYQGWNSVQFDFINDGIVYENKLDGAFQIMGDPVRGGLFPSAAQIYLRGDVKEAQTGYYTSYTKADAINIDKQNSTQPNMMFMLGKSGIICEDITDYEASNVSLLEKLNDDVLISDTEELSWDKVNNIFMMDTSKSKGAAGFVKYKNLDFDGVSAKFTNDYATFMLTSLDDFPIDESRHMLLTVGARERNTDFETDYIGSTVIKGGKAPAIVEAVEGQLTIKSDGDFTVYILNASGKRVKEAKLYKNTDGFTVLDMSAKDKTLHYEIVRN